MTTENGTNGASETKGPNVLQQLHEQWVQAGKKVPTDAVLKTLVKAYKEASKARDAAEEVFKEAKDKEGAAVRAIILNCGKGRVKIGGRVLTPMSKGDSVYFRPEGSGEVRDLG